MKVSSVLIAVSSSEQKQRISDFFKSLNTKPIICDNSLEKILIEIENYHPDCIITDIQEIATHKLVNYPFILINDVLNNYPLNYYEILPSYFQENDLLCAFATTKLRFERKTADATLEQSLKFEKAISSISSSFVYYRDIDKAIDYSLRELGLLSGADRTYVFLLHDNVAMSNTHEWCREGVTPQRDSLQNLDISLFPWWMEQLKAGKTINIDSVKEMDANVAAAEKTILEQQDIQSLVVIPLMSEKKLKGFIGFDNLNEATSWSQSNLNLLGITAQLITNALEKKQAEHELRMNENRYREIFEMSKVGLWEIDLSNLNKEFQKLKQKPGFDLDHYFKKPHNLIHTLSLLIINYINMETVNIFKVQSKEAFITGIRRFITKDSLKTFESILKDYYRGKTIFEVEAQNRDNDGNLLTAIYRISVSNDSSNNKAFLSIVDITEHNKAHDAVLNSQRLESIGYLAGGIAHDFNNLLTTVLGNVSLLRSYLPEDTKAEEYYLKAVNTINQASKLTKQLLTFSRGGHPIRRTASIAKLINDTLTLALSGSNVKKKVTYTENLKPVDIDTGQISQALNNIFLNSIQAMPEGGTLEIHCENQTFMENSFNGLEAGEYVVTKIKDSGHGIEKKYLNRVFDPYFTTQKLGKEKGTGLGLSIAHSIVRKHNGYISFDSVYGIGTTVTIYLPASSHTKISHEESDSIYKKDLILLMDDEMGILDISHRILRQFGYEVDTTRDGYAAIEKYKEAIKNKNCYAAVILDLTVPGGMGGKETMQELLKIDPDVRAIVASGYSNDPILAEYEKYGFKASIEKPFTFEQLNLIIRRISRR